MDGLQKGVIVCFVFLLFFLLALPIIAHYDTKNLNSMRLSKVVCVDKGAIIVYDEISNARIKAYETVFTTKDNVTFHLTANIPCVIRYN